MAGHRRRARRLETGRAPEVRAAAALKAKTLSPLYADACAEAADISFVVGVEHLVLAIAKAGALPGVDADDVRQRIVEDQREALATFGISFDAVHDALDRGSQCLPITPETKRMLELATRRRKELTPEQLLATLREHSANARRLLDETG